MRVRLPWGKSTNTRFSLDGVVLGCEEQGKWGDGTPTYRVEFDEPVEQPMLFQPGDRAPVSKFGGKRGVPARAASPQVGSESRRP